jgi:hypothetical protein
MDCIVDAGEVMRARGVTARDCANLVAIELGDRAQFPITVYVPATEESYLFELSAEDPPKKQPQSERVQLGAKRA